MSANVYKATLHYVGEESFFGTPPSGYAQTIETNGDRKVAPMPMKMLLVSGAACTAADVISIRLKKKDVTDYNVEVTAERMEDHPRAIINFHVHHIVHDRRVSERAVADGSSFPTQNTDFRLI